MFLAKINIYCLSSLMHSSNPCFVILYNFKKWLQQHNAVPLLNYVHAFEDFNRRFFAKAELTQIEIDAFHKELSQIIDGYFSVNSRGKIPVKNKINQGSVYYSDTFPNIFSIFRA